MIREMLAREFDLTEAELEQRPPSGTTKTYANRVAWTLSHMKGARLIEAPRRGGYRITERRRHALSETGASNRVDLRFLGQFPEYRQFRSGEHGDVGWRRALRHPPPSKPTG